MSACDHRPDDEERSGTLPQRVRQAADLHLGYRRRATLRMLLAFVVSFGLVRLLSYAIRANLGPFHDIVVGGSGAGGIHLHHYVWGILLVAVSGFLALSLDAPRWHPLLAIPFGIGLALILDEFALLLELRDVYWAEDGRRSVDAVALLSALLFTYYLGQCFWRDVVTEVRRGLGRVGR